MGLRTALPAGRRWIGDSYFPVLALGLLVRAAWALSVPVQPVSDSYVYNLLARNLANGLGYCWFPGNPTAYWPVGTSFVYSLFYRVFGAGFTPIVVFNIAISVATIWLTMLLAERWFGRWVAIAAGYITALWPVQIEFTTVLASELIFNLLMLAMLVAWESSRLNPWVKAILIGLLGAASCYIRPVGMLLPAILYAMTINRERKFAMPAAGAAVSFLVMFLAIAPWSLRNTRTFGQFVAISTNGGVNLWMGNNPDSMGGTVDIPDSVVQMQEAERDAYLGKLAKSYILQYPGRFVARTLHKAWWLYDHETIGVHWNLPALERLYGDRAVWLLKLDSDTYWWAVLLLGLAGGVLLAVQRGVWATLTSPPIALWAYITALHAVIVVQDRYHFSSLPFIGILAAVALCAAGKKLGSREVSPAATNTAST